MPNIESIVSGYIRDQTRKLSKIAPKCGRLLAFPKFWGRAFQKLYPHYHPSLAARRYFGVVMTGRQPVMPYFTCRR